MTASPHSLATGSTSSNAGKKSAIQGYSHINILVTDLDAAHDFYIEKLGFEVLPRPDFGDFKGAWYRVGALQLHLSVVEQMPDLRGGFPHMAFHIPAQSFDRTIDNLKEAGVPFIIDTTERVDFGQTVRAAFCKDPDGNAIELTDVGPLA